MAKIIMNVIIRRLGRILDLIRSVEPLTEGKAFVDSAPLLEKAWAREAGLGWPGRHSVLINREIGSFFFIGVILVNIKLEYDEPVVEDFCGGCRLCIESCPTGAINENRTIDVRRCIAYLTIEYRGPVPDELAGKMDGRVYGCDKCQEVCPWNKNAKPHNIPEFNLSSELENMTREEWLSLIPDRFNELFRKSPVRRAKYEGMMRKIEIVSKTRSLIISSFIAQDCNNNFPLLSRSVKFAKENILPCRKSRFAFSNRYCFRSSYKSGFKMCITVVILVVMFPYSLKGPSG